MTINVQRSIKGVLCIAMLAGAEVSSFQDSSQFGYATEKMKALKALEMELTMAKPSFQEEAKIVHKKINAELTNPSILAEAKRVSEQMGALMALPNVQEQVQVFAKRVEVNIQEQMKLVTQNMETMQAGDPKFQEQAERAVEQMKNIIAKSVTEEMRVFLADPSFQKQANMLAVQMQSTQGKMVEKMFDRSLKPSSFEHVGLQNTMLGKPASLSTKPGMAVKSSFDPRSVRASSDRSAIRVRALVPRLKVIQDAVNAPKHSRLVRASAIFQKKKKMPVPEPEMENEFISEELEDNIREVAFLFMRLAAASVMIHHGQEKILSAEAFTRFAIDKYFAFLPGPHIFWTYSAGGVQFIGPILLSLGVFSRAAAISLAGTMVAAGYYSLASTGLEGFPLSKMASKVPIFHNYGFETPVLYLAIFLTVFASGPGKLSIAQALGWNDDKSLLGKIKQ